MPEERLMLCDGCRKSFPISDMRYLPRGKDSKIVLCSACRNKDRDRKVTSIDDLSKKQLYLCARCNYKFKSTPLSISKLKCPYCGKSDGILEYNGLSSDALIKLSEESK